MSRAGWVPRREDTRVARQKTTTLKRDVHRRRRCRGPLRYETRTDEGTGQNEGPGVEEDLPVVVSRIHCGVRYGRGPETSFDQTLLTKNPDPSHHLSTFYLDCSSVGVQLSVRSPPPLYLFIVRQFDVVLRHTVSPLHRHPCHTFSCYAR